MAHTPGPWEMQAVTDQYQLNIVDARGAFVALAKETDARLIAAAPALLVAVEALTAYLQRELIPNVREIVGGQEVLDNGWRLVTEAWAAIKPAKGDA